MESIQPLPYASCRYDAPETPVRSETKGKEIADINRATANLYQGKVNPHFNSFGGNAPGVNKAERC